MDKPPPVPISARESEVLAELGEGRSNAEIAHRLHISVRTVETHVSSMLRKLGAGDRRALAALAGPRTGASSPQSTVPPGRTTFVGRRTDREAVAAALADDRLVNIVGPGGMGKTRLAAVVAAAVAPAFPAGVAFLDLVPVSPGLVIQALAAALGVSERPPQPLDRTIAGRLSEGRFLLILDNCEHLIDEVCALVGPLLERCPNLAVLATSRQRLGVPGEHLVKLAGLPDDPDGVRLFYDRARAVDGDLDLNAVGVADICTRLDGMPLAIEIAAARAASLGLDGLRAAVGDQLRLLSGARGVPDRHASLDAVMSWSYELLDDDERVALRALSLFCGRFDLSSAAAVTGVGSEEQAADLIGRLVDRSLAVRESTAGRTRWRLLETVRAFASEQVEEAERQAVVRRYLTWAAETTARLEASLDRAWMPGFDDVVDDLRAALRLTTADPDAVVHDFAHSLGHLAFARGLYLEARRHYLAAADRAADARQSIEDIRAAASVATAVYDGPAAFDLLIRAADEANAAGLTNAAAASWAAAVSSVSRFPGESRPSAATGRLSSLLEAATDAADPSDASVAAQIAIARAWQDRSRSGVGAAELAVDAARAAGHPILQLEALDALWSAALDEGRCHDVSLIDAERLRLIADLPRHDPAAATEIADTFNAVAGSALSRGDLPIAAEVVDRARTEDPLAEHPYSALPRRIRVLTLLGRFDEAIEEANSLWHEWQRDGRPSRLWMSTAIASAAMAHGLSEQGDYPRWRARSLAVAETEDATRSPVLAACLAFVDARVALHTGSFGKAELLVDNAFASFPQRHWEAYAQSAGAELAVAANLPDAADRIAAATPRTAENRWAAACLARARGRLTDNAVELRASGAQWADIDARFEHACTLMLLPDRADEGRAEPNA